MEVIKAREPTKRDNKLQGLKGDATAGKEIISGSIKHKTLVKEPPFKIIDLINLLRYSKTQTPSK